jgi:hypothetical protein
MTDAIIEGMARAMFVDAWGDREEEQDRHYPGQDLMDVAPETPEYAVHQAWRLCGMFEQLNGMAMICLLAAAMRADGADDKRFLDDDVGREFGHYMAMEARGHGVSWFDDHEKFQIEFPLFCFELEDT